MPILPDSVKHTPIPWFVCGGMGPKHIGIAAGRPGFGTLIVDSFSETAKEKETERWWLEQRANAEFIVQACNAHDNLLATCELVLASLRNA